MHTGTVGNTLTAAALGNGTRGNANLDGWGVAPDPPTGFTIGAHADNRALGGVVVVDAVEYGPSNASQSLAFDHTQNFTVVLTSLTAGKRRVTMAGWITFGPPQVAPGSAVLFDYLIVHGAATGQYVCLQLLNGAAPGNTYGLNLETNPGGVTTHSAYITLVPGDTYWVTFQADFTGGTARLEVYSTAFVQGGATASVAQTTGEDIQIIRIGNNEAGTAAATSYFENWLVDYTNAVFPLGPGRPSLRQQRLLLGVG